MLNWIGTAITSGFGFGKEYLKGKRQVEDAKIGLELAELRARTEQASQVMQMELEVRRRTGDLDRLTMLEAAKSWWDEFICLIPLGMLVYAIFDPDGALAAFTSIEALPVWFLILIGLIYVRYLGFRSLLRLWIKSRGKRGFEIGVESKEGKDENGRKAEAYRRHE